MSDPVANAIDESRKKTIAALKKAVIDKFGLELPDDVLEFCIVDTIDKLSQTLLNRAVRSGVFDEYAKTITTCAKDMTDDLSRPHN